ncbi:MAG: hypothetical protein D6772_06390, partial [Bacteroidetes bacterium]
TNSGGTFKVSLKNADELVAIVSSKYRDSRRLIQAVHTHLSRRWWYPVFGRALARSNRLEWNVIFWQRVYNLLYHSSRKSFVLWVGLENPNENYLRYLDRRLAQELGAEIHTELAPGELTRLAGVRVVPARY